MTDEELIRKGDALAAVRKAHAGEWEVYGWGKIHERIAALPAVTVRVKPLVWEWNSATQAHRADAPISGGVYFIWKMGNGWVLSMRSKDKPYITLEAAKAAAQADYEARILAALEPVTQPAPDAAAIRNAALREAAEVCASIRQRIANGPMPEGARFDYEQAILALITEKPHDRA